MTPVQKQQVEFVCTEVGKVLAHLMNAPSHKGQQVIIHISKDRQDVWIEKPAEIIHIRVGDVKT